MKIEETFIEGAFLIESKKYEDKRGFFMETWNDKQFALPRFVQDNFTYSRKNVLRGLHYQIGPNTQGKLVRCSKGSVYDVIVDIRKHSASFGNWFGRKLDQPEIQLWVPAGLAHGFYTLSETAEFNYKVTDYYDPESERTLLWNDPELNIKWPLQGNPILSKKDSSEAKLFSVCTKL